MKLPEPTFVALNEGLPDSPIASVRALPAGARLDEFEVEEIIGEGSVKIVYAATDHVLAIPVAIAEYMPARLAQRNHEAQVTPLTAAQADTFTKGLTAFIDETRMLARCDHPSLVRVMRLREANGTAYRAMPHYRGRTLLQVRRDLNEPPDEQAVRTLLDALLGALEAFHRAGGCHGKVTPSNILLLEDDRPLLLGPGSAGRAIAGERIDALMASVEPFFEPLEQIVETDIPLHPSADLYALAGVARYWMSGQLPAPAFGALGTARRETLAETVQLLYLTWPHLRYSASLLDALDSALSIYPAERPQSVAQMRARLSAALPAKPPAAGGAVTGASNAAPVVEEAVPSPPVPTDEAQDLDAVMPSASPPVPTYEAQDLDAVMPSAPDHDSPLTSGFARIEEDPSVLKAATRRVPSGRRIAMGIGAVLVLLALLLIGMDEFRQGVLDRRVLDIVGISRGTGSQDSAPVSAAVPGPAAPATPPIAAPEPAKPTPTEPMAADSPAVKSAPASPASPDDATPAAAATAPVAVKPPAAPTPPLARADQRHASPASPREACGGRTQFSLYRCMQTQCSQRRWASHAQCERLRATDSVD